MSSHIVTASVRLIIASALILPFAGCGDRGNNRQAICEADSECEGEQPFCGSAGCVECLADNQCGCHEICVQTVCVPYGADDNTQRLNAHGLWAGTPGEADYKFEGSCASDNECSIGEICNPFTAGCVSAADFTSSCAVDDCAAGFACAPSPLEICLPTPLCKSDSNCCGGDAEFVCDLSANLCRTRQDECQPPPSEDVTATCPLQPKLDGECSDGRFCSLLGECVECTCNSDCGSGLKCHNERQQCVAIDFCTAAIDCNQPADSCDLSTNTCAPRCTDNANCADTGTCCEDDEFCRASDSVCRPRSDLPCTGDAWESNDSRLGAADLTDLLPARGATRTIDGFSLCNGDVDWYGLDLQAGDRLVMDGTSFSDLSADLTVYAPDGVTVLDTGRIRAFGSELLDFTANRDETYFLSVVPSDGSGFYSLSIARQVGSACTDAFEDANGFDDVPGRATSLYDWLSPGTEPASCTVTAAPGVDTVSCDGLQMCAGDVDYYLVRAPTGGTITLRLSDFAGDLDLHLYGPFEDPAMASTALPVDSADSRDPTEIVSTIARPGAFYLAHVARISGGATTYSLQSFVSTSAVACVEDAYDAVDAGDGSSLSPVTIIDDPADMNDSFSSATHVGLLADTDVFLTTAGTTPLTLCHGDVDWFSLGIATTDNSGNLVDIPENYRIEIEVQVAEGSPSGLTLAAGVSEFLLPWGSNNPDQPSGHLLIGRTDGTSTYYVKVQSDPSNTRHVDYTLRARLIVPPVCDDDVLGDNPSDNHNLLSAATNDAPAHATQLLPGVNGDWPAAIAWPNGGSFLYEAGSSDELTLCSGNDDWYTIDVPANAQVRAWVEYDPAMAEVGLALFDGDVASLTDASAGTPPAQGRLDQSSRDGLGYQRVIGTPTSGNAFLMVWNRTGWPLLDYKLGVQFMPNACADDAYENNDTWDIATNIPLMQLPFERQIEVGVLDPLAICSSEMGEMDWYSVPLTPGDRLDASVFYDPNAGNLDLYLHAPGPGGINDELAYDWDDFEDTGILNVSHTVNPADPGGTYLLRVVPFSTPRNFYHIEAVVRRACVDDMFEPSAPEEIAALNWTTPPLSIPDAVLCNDEDWYYIDGVSAGDELTLCVNFDHAQGDIDAEAWATVDSSGDQPAGTGTRIASARTKQDTERVYISSAPGPFYMRIFLDPRDRVNTDYGLLVLEGDQICGPIICDSNNALTCSENGTCDAAGNGGRGLCQCDTGFAGEQCGVCEPDFYGPACTACSCTGLSVCNDGLSGDGSCS